MWGKVFLMEMGMKTERNLMKDQRSYSYEYKTQKVFNEKISRETQDNNC